MRLRLKKIDQYIFSTFVKIRITDLNYGNHLANEMILNYAQEARVELLKKLGGWNELDIAGVGLIMTDTAVVYKSEGKAGEQLEVALAIDDKTRVGFDFYYKITEINTGREIALVKTGIVFFDYATKKVSVIPAVFWEALQLLENENIQG